MNASTRILLVTDRDSERDHVHALLEMERDPPLLLSHCKPSPQLTRLLRTQAFDVMMITADTHEQRRIALEPWLCDLALIGPQPLLLLRDGDENTENLPSSLPTLGLQQLTSTQLHDAIDDAMRRRRTLREKLRSEIAHALVRGEMELRYQPVLDLRRGRLNHVEVLLRWRHPLYGLMTPEHFLDVAEASGAIHPLGIWTLRRAREQQLRWMELGLPLIPLSINVADCQLEKETFTQALDECLRGGSAAIGLEISAAALERCSGAVRTRLTEWHARGVHLTADHIGGDQTAASLQGLPLDALKFDRVLLDHCESDPQRAAALKSLLELGQSLGCNTIAAGVGHRATARYLRRQRCDQLQGFCVARPLSGAEMVSWANQRKHIGLH